MVIQSDRVFMLQVLPHAKQEYSHIPLTYDLFIFNT
jgi:hypothetical protein